MYVYICKCDYVHQEETRINVQRGIREIFLSFQGGYPFISGRFMKNI